MKILPGFTMLFLLLPVAMSCEKQPGAADFKPANIKLELIKEWNLSKPELIPDPAHMGFLKDTSIVFVDRSLYHTVHFSGGGELISTLGGRGRGPGEFQSMNDVAVHPEGYVAIADLNSARITITHVYTNDVIYLDLDVGWSTRLSWQNDKLFITNSPFRLGAESEPGRGDVLIRYYDLNKKEKIELKRLVLYYDAPEDQISCTFCNFSFSETMHFYTAPRDTSYRVFRVHPFTDERQLYTRAGAPLVRYTEEERETIRQQRQRAGAMQGSDLGSLPIPEFKRRVVNFFADHHNRVWVSIEVEQGEPALFDVFSKEGNYLGGIHAPHNAATLVYHYGDILVFRFDTENPDLWRGAAYRIAS